MNPSILFLNGPETEAKKLLCKELKDVMNDYVTVYLNRKSLLKMFNCEVEYFEDSYEWIVQKLLKTFVLNGVFVIFDGFLPTRRMKQYSESLNGLSAYWIGIFFNGLLQEHSKDFYDYSIILDEESFEQYSNKALDIFNFLKNNEPVCFPNKREVNHLARKRTISRTDLNFDVEKKESLIEDDVVIELVNDIEDVESDDDICCKVEENLEKENCFNDESLSLIKNDNSIGVVFKKNNINLGNVDFKRGVDDFECGDDVEFDSRKDFGKKTLERDGFKKNDSNFKASYKSRAEKDNKSRFGHRGSGISFKDGKKRDFRINENRSSFDKNDKGEFSNRNFRNRDSFSDVLEKNGSNVKDYSCSSKDGSNVKDYSCSSKDGKNDSFNSGKERDSMMSSRSYTRDGKRGSFGFNGKIKNRSYDRDFKKNDFGKKSSELSGKGNSFIKEKDGSRESGSFVGKDDKGRFGNRRFDGRKRDGSFNVEKKDSRMYNRSFSDKDGKSGFTRKRFFGGSDGIERRGRGSSSRDQRGDFRSDNGFDKSGFKRSDRFKGSFKDRKLPGKDFSKGFSGNVSRNGFKSRNSVDNMKFSDVVKRRDSFKRSDDRDFKVRKNGDGRSFRKGSGNGGFRKTFGSDKKN